MSFFAGIETTGEFEISANFEPIPEGTQVVALANEAKWDEYEGTYYISIAWEILQGEFKNRKIFQKLRVRDDDQKKREKAIKMLAAIDKNAGGLLMRQSVEPSDESLAQALLNKPMALRLGLWDMNGKTGNYVQAVAPIARQGAPSGAPMKRNPIIESDVPF